MEKSCAFKEPFRKCKQCYNGCTGRLLREVPLVIFRGESACVNVFVVERGKQNRKAANVGGRSVFGSWRGTWSFVEMSEFTGIRLALLRQSIEHYTRVRVRVRPVRPRPWAMGRGRCFPHQFTQHLHQRLK